jgi:hypothetical protein
VSLLDEDVFVLVADDHGPDISVHTTVGQQATEAR